jgi:hypothetical protein
MVRREGEESSPFQCQVLLEEAMKEVIESCVKRKVCGMDCEI